MRLLVSVALSPGCLTHTVPATVCSFDKNTPFGPTGAGNPFKLSLTVGTTAYTAAVYR